MISETSESSFSSSSSRFRFTPRLLEIPARLPLGLPPRLTLAPRARPRADPRPSTGVLMTEGVSPLSGGSTFTLGVLPPRPRRAPLLTPLIGLVGGVTYCGGVSIRGAVEYCGGVMT